MPWSYHDFQWQDGMYKCAVTVTAIANNNNWWYISCVPCKKRAEQQPDHTYKCPKCHGSNVVPRYSLIEYCTTCSCRPCALYAMLIHSWLPCHQCRYLLGFRARDDTGEARFFAYDEEAKLIIQKDCEAIVNPLALQRVYLRHINKRYVFSIDHTDDSCRGHLRRQYLVKSVLERPPRHAPAPKGTAAAGPSTSMVPPSSTEPTIPTTTALSLLPGDDTVRVDPPTEQVG